MNYLIDRKSGQSLVELAAFGSILLLCLSMLIQYGMRANYQQNLQMQAFRKALRAAYYKSGPAAGTSITMVHDKAIPDPRDHWGIAERRPVTASASATWDSHIQANYIEDFASDPSPNDLPRTIIEINDTLALAEASISDGGIDNIGPGDGAFTLANYITDGCHGSITMVLENPRRTAQRREYRSVVINCEHILVKNRRTSDEDPGIEYAYVKIDGLVHTVLTADIDGDGELETVIAVRGDQACDSEGYCGRLAQWQYIDHQSGDIDSKYMAVSPWETDKADASLAAVQGLVGDYTIEKTYHNILVNTETPVTSTSATHYLDAAQSITRIIRLNDGSELTYVTEFRPETSSFEWSVDK